MKELNKRVRFAHEYAKEKIKPEYKVLDVGCRNGKNTIMLEKAKEIVGIDLSNESIAEAKILCKNKKQFSFYAMNAESLEFADNSFDVITCFQVIEHIELRVKALQEIHRVLKPNGLLLLTTPNREQRLKEQETPWNWEHKKEYTKNELEELIKYCFQDYSIKAIQTTKENWVKERKRIKLMKQINYLEKFRLKSVLLKAYGTIKPIKEETGLSFSNYWIIDKEIEKGLDLLVEAREGFL